MDMKLIAFSDVERWDIYENVVDREKPDIIALAGDLVCDGSARVCPRSWKSSSISSESEMKKAQQSHVEKFYQFLEYAGKRAIVLVVKGDHDEDDIKGAYVPEKKVFGFLE